MIDSRFADPLTAHLSLLLVHAINAREYGIQVACEPGQIRAVCSRQLLHMTDTAGFAYSRLPILTAKHLSPMQSMLPKIMALWDALHVPLIHRSRFYLAFRGREAFYFETEKRRLAWLQSEMGDPEDRNPLNAQRAKRALARNFRKLDVRPICTKLLRLF